MRWLRRGRHCGWVAALATCGALLMPQASLAGQDTIFNGYMDYGGMFGPRHTLTSVWTTWYNYEQSCINAWDETANYWAGATVCAWSGDVNVVHGYCACNLKYGYGQSKYASTVTYAYTRQFW